MPLDVLGRTRAFETNVQKYKSARSLSRNCFLKGSLYLSPLEGAKPPREGDRHSPYYANMRLEFIN